jgi:protein-tyrosine-phosphatase
MAEAIFNRLGEDHIHAYSAGSTPRGIVNPLAIELLQSLGYQTGNFQSKSWDEFTETPEMDVVITVCDNAANEVCPIWPGAPLTGHWGINDPDQPQETPETQRDLFRQAYKILENKITMFVDKSPQNMEDHELQALLDQIGNT